MSGRDKLDTDRSEPDEVYLPGERFQPHPPINWRAEIVSAVLTLTIFAALIITGLYEVLHRYVPGWAWGLLLAGFGLFFILRPGAAAGSRFGTIVSGCVLVLIGALIAFSQA